MRSLPNMVCMAPRDEAMLPAMLRTALTYDDGPICLRYPRGEGVGVPVPPPAEVQAIEIGKGEVLREGTSVALVGYGTGVQKALEAADLLADHDLDVTVADARFAKPIDLELMQRLAADHELLVTVEEGVLAGGFGSAVWEALNDAGAELPRILRIGMPDRYVTHGKPALLHREVGYTGKAIAERITAEIGAAQLA
jgi:1-deoxy-D-xylulose-5-phosphate synthase